MELVYLSHKTGDLILDHNYNRPLQLWGFSGPEFSSLFFYVRGAAVLNRCRLHISFRQPGGEVIIRKADQ